jgi:hypothetical protein
MDTWCPEKDYPGRKVTLQVRKGDEVIATFRRFKEVDEFIRERGLKEGVHVTVVDPSP